MPAARGINFEGDLLHDVLQRNLLHCVRTSCREKNGGARSVSLSVLCSIAMVNMVNQKLLLAPAPSTIRR